MFMYSIMIVIGFVLLVLGAELLVRGSLDKAGILGKTMRWTRVPDSEKSKYTPLKRSQLRRLN